MKLVNSRGRVILEVTKAELNPNPRPGGAAILYTYTGGGMGGYTDLPNLLRKIEYVKLDHPSAREVGELPKP